MIKFQAGAKRLSRYTFKTVMPVVSFSKNIDKQKQFWMKISIYFWEKPNQLNYCFFFVQLFSAHSG